MAKKKIDPAFIELALPIPINAKETIVQPNRITNASMSYNRRQMDILILIMDRLQVFISEVLSGIHVEQLNIFQEQEKMLTLKIPVKDFGLAPNRYPELKQDLADMAVIPVRFQQLDPTTGERMEFASGLYTVKMPVRWGRAIEIQIHRDIAKHYIDITKGFTKYNKQFALALKSSYAKRLYMFISSWKSKGGTVIDINTFREIMNVTDKYPSYKDLYRWTIKPSYLQFKEKADCWFEVSPCYREGEKEPYQLVFKIISRPSNAFEENKLKMQKDNIRHGLVNLGLTSTHIEEVLSFVHPDNVVDCTGKIFNLIDTDIDRKDIHDRDAYYYQAILNYMMK
ncbi:replication initiation protein [Bacteroides acidifaciens]|uniref:replication initiation protein n=1 Tax=Bacteroides acidifaciens TaxID=85831 RepID=UPI002593A30E|nr:replication initiation protein [Bacteroides acidifaciens]